MLVFTLFALINLCIGYAVAVLLGHGPTPWYAIFLPAPGSDVIQIDALEAETDQPSNRAADEDDQPFAEAPVTVNYPFPEMNEPEDQQPEPDSSEDDLPVAAEAEQPEQEPQLERPAPANEDDDDDIEKFLAAGKSKPAPQVDESLTGDELASVLATQDAFEKMEAAAEETAAADEPAAEADELPGEAEPEFDAETTVEEGVAAETEAAVAEPEEADTEESLGQDDIAALFNQV